MKFLSFTYPWLEGILKEEIKQRNVKVNEIGPWFVIFSGDEKILVKMNLWLRTANKVYILLNEWKVKSFSDVYNLVFSIDWKKYINWFDFYIKPRIVKSVIASWRSLQSVSHKAIVKKLVNDKTYIPSKNKKLEIRLDLFKDNLKVLLDTSWDPLYKRGYKLQSSKAWLKETLAAWIILLSKCKEEIFCDPFCWSWTILIEKALIDLNIPPWIFRNFIFEEFSWLDKTLLEKEKFKAKLRRKNKNLNFVGYDIDYKMVEIAQNNVKKAWLENFIKIQQADYLSINLKESFITNPPYWGRIKVKNLKKIYDKLFSDLKKVKSWWVITSYKDKKFYDNFKVRVLSNWGKKVFFFWK